MKDILDILKNCNLFENFEVEEIRKLLSCLDYRIEEYKKGNIILMSGDEITSIGIVLNGRLQITRDDLSGNSTIISNLDKSNIFAEAIVCSNIKISPVTVTAIEKSNIMYIPYSNIINICSNTCSVHTKLIYNMIKTISNKNINLADKIEILSAKSIREKLDIFFLKQIQKNKSKKFTIHFSREELASFLNVNRSALSRELSRMQKEGLLSFNKNEFKINI